MADPYEVLGIARTASAEDIRRAYRKLAKRFHPDLNPGKSDAERRFKDISAAYALLSDPEKKRKFDRGEIDETGTPREERAFYHGFADAAGGDRYGPDARSAGFEDLEGLFENLFTGNRRDQAFRMAGGTLRLGLTVDFMEAARGARKRLSLPDGRTLDVEVPPGIEDGQSIRLKGQGLPGIGGGPPGDALITIGVRPHPFFRRNGRDISLELPITLSEAVLGAKIRVPTIDGPVAMTVSRNANSGTVLRLKERGVSDPKGGKPGDQYVTLRIVLPERPDPELEAFMRSWRPGHVDDPRRQMETS